MGAINPRRRLRDSSYGHCRQVHAETAKRTHPVGATSCGSGNKPPDCRPAQRRIREETTEALAETKHARAVLDVDGKAEALVVPRAK